MSSANNGYKLQTQEKSLTLEKRAMGHPLNFPGTSTFRNCHRHHFQIQCAKKILRTRKRDIKKQNRNILTSSSTEGTDLRYKKKVL